MAGDHEGAAGAATASLVERGQWIVAGGMKPVEAHHHKGAAGAATAGPVGMPVGRHHYERVSSLRDDLGFISF